MPSAPLTSTVGRMGMYLGTTTEKNAHGGAGWATKSAQACAMVQVQTFWALRKHAKWAFVRCLQTSVSQLTTLALCSGPPH